MLFVDGHSDFDDNHLHVYGEVTGMDLAIVTGHKHFIPGHIDVAQPYIAGTDARVFGFREEGMEEHSGYQDVRASGSPL